MGGDLLDGGEAVGGLGDDFDAVVAFEAVGQCETDEGVVDDHDADLGTVYGGSDAVAKLLMSAGGAWSPRGAALLVPVARSAAHVLYRLVAANRSRLPGRSGPCAVPEPRSA
ncbi:thiol-disulfide oxidoreductase DCC family protein [Streptomyces sp. NPDC001705]